MISSMAASVSPQTARAVASLRWARCWHLATFTVGAFGVGVQLWIEATHPLAADRVAFPVPIRLWNVLSFFTVWSNILVTVVTYLLSRDPRRRGPVFSVFHLASLVMITVTGVVYAVILAPLWSPTGWQKVADQTLHYAVPLLAVAGYLLFGPRPSFTLRTLWLSLPIPLAWLAYTLVRSPLITYTQDGKTRHWYPYHFINLDDLGYGRVLFNIAAVALLLLAVGWLYRFLDRRLPPAPTR
jgi:hypothetical protein